MFYLQIKKNQNQIVRFKKTTKNNRFSFMIDYYWKEQNSVWARMNDEFN